MTRPPARPSSTRSPRVASTTTCSGRRRRPTSSSTTRSRACCSTGPRRSARRPTPSPSSASRGRGARTSSGRYSAVARCRTRSTWPIRRTAAPSSSRPERTRSCRSSSSPTARCCTTPPTRSSRKASGSPVHPERMDFDLVIVGAGPAGLSAAVYGASEGFSTLVVDEGGVGGQATSSSLIRNYLGFPRGISGRRLAQDAYQQAWVFGASFAFMQRVTDIRADGDELAVSLSEGACVRSRAVLLADRRDVPPTRRAGAGGAERRGCLLRQPRLGGVTRRRGATSTSSAVRTPPARPRCTWRASPVASRSSSAPSHSTPACRTTSSARSRRRRTSPCGSAPRSWAAAATPGSSSWFSAPAATAATRPSPPTRSSS